MLGAGRGLTEVETRHLETLLRMLVRGEVHGPLTVVDLARVGLQHCAEPLLDALRGLDDRACRAVLIAVLAERRAT